MWIQAFFVSIIVFGRNQFGTHYKKTVIIIIIIIIIKCLYSIFNFKIENIKHFNGSVDLPIRHSSAKLSFILEKTFTDYGFLTLKNTSQN